MKFDAMNDEQLEAERAERLKQFQPLPKGDYKFEVIMAEDKLSQAGKEMIEITLRIWDKEGVMREIRDWLTTGFMIKLKHFCYATGLEDVYESGTLGAGQCMFKTGIVSLDIDKGKPNPNGGMYPDRNKVVDYVKTAGFKESAPVAQDEFDADVGF